ncbi:MAG: TorF family putative porin [Legionellaceae bacterium]|nr:TorF family putative porin [Legionellaceae bacterium]
MIHRFLPINVTRTIVGLLLVICNPMAISTATAHYIDKQKQQQFIKDFRSFQFSPKLILTSNYVWRGVSQSDNHPAIQGNLLWHDKLGLYSGLFGTNANFKGTNDQPVTSEFQLYTGYKADYAGFMYDVGVRRYIYPNAVGPDFTEGFFLVGYGIFNAGIARSNEVSTLYGDGGTYHGTYYSAQVLYELPLNVHETSILKHLKIGGHIGRYNFSSSNLRDNSYTDYRLSVAKSYPLITFELAWTDTSNAYAFIAQRTKSMVALSMIVCW